jgi:phage/plasmid-like protein (TIGR03299 family)
MAHNLTTTSKGTEFFTASGKPEWHKLGQVVKGTVTAEKAMELAKLDWNVVKANVMAIMPDGSAVNAPDFSAIMREDTKQVFGVLGDGYSIIQNKECFSFFDSVVGAGEAYYDTAGSLFGGSKVFITAKLPRKLFIGGNKNEETETMVLLYTSHDGSKALSMQVVTTRVVCWNTLSVALNSASNRIHIRHTKNYANKADDAKRALGLANKNLDVVEKTLNAFYTLRINAKQAESLVASIFPGKTDENGKTEEVSKQTENARGQVLDLFSRGRGNRGQTAYDLLNGLTEFVDHHRGTRVTTGTSEADLKFDSALFGSGATLKQKGFDTLVGFAGIGSKN